MADEKLSVIVPVFNKAEYSQRCLKALLQTSWRPMELIVVDNGSTDDTPQVLRETSASAREAGIDFRLISNDSNLGACTARNQALAAAEGEFIALLDNDVVIGRRSWAQRLIDVLHRRSNVGIVGPKLLFASPPNLIQFAGGAVTPSGRVDFIGRGKPADAPEFNTAREVQCFISACWMMPRRIYDELGGFDEEFNPVQFEDIDFSYRVRNAGYKILYEPGVWMYHFENVTTGMSPSLNSTYLIIKNGLKFKKRWNFIFAKENGPSDDSIVWLPIEKVPLHQIGELEMAD